MDREEQEQGLAGSDSGEIFGNAGTADGGVQGGDAGAGGS